MIEEAKEIFSLFDKVKIWAWDLDFKRFPGWGLFHPNPGAGHCHESDGNISKGAPPPLSLFHALLSIIFLLNLFLPVSLQWYPGGGAAATEWNHRRGEFVSLTVFSVKKYCKVCDSLVTQYLSGYATPLKINKCQSFPAIIVECVSYYLNFKAPLKGVRKRSVHVPKIHSNSGNFSKK